MARRPSRERLSRILSIVPWIASHDEGVAIDEVSERFGLDRQELLADLDIALCIGIYPHYPGDYLNVEFDESWVRISYTNFFEHPPRLTHAEALALLAAGVVASTQPGYDDRGALARGVDKLARALGIDISEGLDVVVSPAEAGAYSELYGAVRDRRVVHLSYFSHARNTETERDIEPLRLFSAEGATYVDAFCRSTGEARLFRLDRITAFTVTDEVFDAPDDGDTEAGDRSIRLGDELPRVTLELPPEHRWVADTYPVDAFEEVDDGRYRVTLAVSARPWLERLLLMLGPSVHVVDAPPELATAGSDAARRLLDTMAGGS